MSKINKGSSEDMIDYGESVLGVSMSGASVIELGPGSGFATKVIVARGAASVTAIEPSRLFQQILSDDAEISAAVDIGVLKIIPGVALSMPYVASSTVDAIFAMNVVYFLAPLDEYLKEIMRVLKPGGVVIFGYKAGVVNGNKNHFVNTDITQIVSAMAAAGFADAKQESDRLKGAGSNRYTPIMGWKPA